MTPLAPHEDSLDPTGAHDHTAVQESGQARYASELERVQTLSGLVAKLRT